MAEILGFNKNRTCIEIGLYDTLEQVDRLFNKNRSCIEIDGLTLIVKSFKQFNKNRSCIEMLFPLQVLPLILRLIRTEVVLKFHSSFCEQINVSV